jgi:hypothetical protein
MIIAPREIYTGSYPPGWRGLHFITRTEDFITPLMAPYVWMASIAYAEQVG